MVTVDGAGFSHKLTPVPSPPPRIHAGVFVRVGTGCPGEGRDPAGPRTSRQIAVDHRGEVRERRADDACADSGCGHRACWIEEAHVTELTGLLREGPGGDQLEWPESMRSSPAASGLTPAPSCPCSSTRRLPLPAMGHQPARRHQGLARQCLHRRRPPGARPGRGLDPHRQRSPTLHVNSWLTASAPARLARPALTRPGQVDQTLRYRVLPAARLVRGAPPPLFPSCLPARLPRQLFTRAIYESVACPGL